MISDNAFPSQLVQMFIVTLISRFSSGLPANAMDKKSVAPKGGLSQPNGPTWDIGLPHTCTY